MPVPGEINDYWPWFDRPATAVEENLDLMNDRADSLLEVATDNIQALGDTTLPADIASPSNLVLPDISIPSANPVTVPVANLFGTIADPRDPEFEDLAALYIEGMDDELLLNPGEFVSTVGEPQFPDVPDAIVIGTEPTAPATATGPTIPEVPTFQIPSDPTLETLTVPTFAGITTPSYTDSEPTFGAVEPNPLSYTEPTYSSALLTATQAEIISMLGGGTGLPAAIEQALFDAARGREQQTALAAEQEAFDTFAGRGFSMPPGMLVEMVDTVRERTRFASNTLSRDILTKSAQWEIENLRFAVTQGIALEGQLRAAFENLAQRTFEVAKSQVEVELKIYEVAVALFNVRQEARKIRAEIYKAQWDGEKIKVEAHKALIEGEIAKGQINEQRVKVFLGQWEGVKAAGERYRTEMDGARIESEIDRNTVQNYSARVQAFAELMKARKIPAEVYAVQMEGEKARASILESQVRAYAETIKAQESEANVKIKFIDLKLQAARASVEKYTARLQYLRDKVQADLAQVQAAAQGFAADTNRYSVELQGVNQARGQEIQVAELRLRNNISYFEAMMRQFDAGMNRQIERAKIIVEAVKGATQASVALSAGAMSAIHVQAGMSGSSSVNASVSTVNQYDR